MTQQTAFFDLSTTEEAQGIVDALTVNGRYDPHRFLGIQHTPSGGRVIRLFRPGATEMHIEVMGYVHEMHLVHSAGLFEIPIAPDVKSLDYRIFHTSGLLAHDPYVFWPTVGELDLHLFSQGTHYELHKRFGGRLMTHQGVKGVAFTVWAPSAQAVSVVGDVTHWDGRSLPMRVLGSSGMWELFVPGLDVGAMYKFEITTATGQRQIKTDPLGLCFELRPKTAAIVADQLATNGKIASGWNRGRVAL
jgi:1,4-alpha-glucan branching enzyme